MLDDLKYITQIDKSDALGVAQKQFLQLTYDFKLPKIDGKFENIVYAGMGGSSLAAEFCKTWPGYALPFEICKAYDIPSYVSAKTLFIASSYSGNTEETLSALAQAEKTKATIIVVTGGGKLQEIANQKSYPLLTIPPVGQPRYGAFYSLAALVAILSAAGLLADSVAEELSVTADFLQDSVSAWLPTVATSKNNAKQLAEHLVGKSAVIYTGPTLAPAGYKWKISINENAKQIAWWNQVSELNHNEISGWTQQPVQKPYGVIELRSSLDHQRINLRFEVMEKMLSGVRPHPKIVNAAGETPLQQLLWTILLGDFVSIYLAILNNVDPSPVTLQENFKKELG